MTKILTLHARYSDTTTTIDAEPTGDALVLTPAQSDAASLDAGLVSGDYWASATDSDGERYDVCVCAETSR